MSLDRAALRRVRYQADPGYRNDCLRSTARQEGRDLRRYPWHKTSFSVSELCRVIGINVWTFDKYQKLGLIPLPTYPARKRRYWTHQAWLVVNLFKRMRRDGWPVVTPHFVGCSDWTKYLTKLQSEWTSRGAIHAAWQVGPGPDDQD